MLHNIVQKDYTFETIFDATIFNYRKIIKVLNNGDYDLVGVEKKWSIRQPFHITIIAIIKVIQDVDLEELRSNASKTFWEKRWDKNKSDT